MLTELSLRSVQQRWGYSDEFMDWEPEAISVSPEHIANDITYVLEKDGRPLGFYVLRGDPPEFVLLRLMVEPSAIGTGLGRLLWEHAVMVAKERGVREIRLDADPNAEPFYLRMGAETVGEHDFEPPMMPGWRLKKMAYLVSRDGA